MIKRVYADNAATTRLSERAFEAMKPYMTEIYGNPSSLYTEGVEARKAVDKAREDIATIYISDGSYRVEWYEMERHWLWFDDERSICKIYVPEDCIKEEYSIDLE